MAGRYVSYGAVVAGDRARARPQDTAGDHRRTGVPSFVVIAGFVATAEDVVLAKLEWAAESGSDRQLRDAAAIVAVTTDLDVAYVDRWAAALGVTAAWGSIREQTDWGQPSSGPDARARRA